MPHNRRNVCVCVVCIGMRIFRKIVQCRYRASPCIGAKRKKQTFIFWNGNVEEIERANEKESNSQMPILNQIVFTGIYLRYKTKLRRESVIWLCVMTYRLHRHVLGILYTYTIREYLSRTTKWAIVLIVYINAHKQ